MAIKTFAAIEVGSSKLEMKIYEISKKLGFRELDHVRYMIALGVDTYTKGFIGYEMVNELCDVLKRFRLKMGEYRDRRLYGSGRQCAARGEKPGYDPGSDLYKNRPSGEDYQQCGAAFPCI